MKLLRGQLAVILFLLILLVACQQNGSDTESGATAVVPTMQPAKTLAPTFTPQATNTLLPTATAPPSSTAAPATETAIPFGETVVTLRYTIPGLGLDRYMEGDSSGKMRFVDDTTGFIIEQDHVEGAIFELRQALPEIELTDAPDGCSLCVQIAYNLPLTDEQGAGWLQDEILLASIENFTSTYLGPHFPPNTILGLRRSASPYAPAHSLALTSDGRLWRWLATEGQIALVDAPAFASSELQTRLNQLPLDQLNTSYIVNCAGTPREILYLKINDVSQTIALMCPEFALPNTLLPLYLQVDSLLADRLADVADPRPPSAFPLTALIDYKRADNSRLTLYEDGTAVAQTPTQILTSTLGLSQINDLVTGLTATGLLKTGLQTFRVDDTDTVTATAPIPTSIILVRGTDGVVDGEWQTLPDDLAFRSLDILLDSLLETAVTEPENTPEPTATAVATPTE